MVRKRLLWQCGQLQLALGCKSVDVRCNSFYLVSASLSPRLCSSRRPKLCFLCGSCGEESPLLNRGWGAHLPRYQRIMLLLVFHPLVIRYYSGDTQGLFRKYSSSTLLVRGWVGQNQAPATIFSNFLLSCTEKSPTI